jgi:hypothetical protein
MSFMVAPTACTGAGGVGGVLFAIIIVVVCILSVVPSGMFYGLGTTLVSPSILWWSVASVALAVSVVRRDCACSFTDLVWCSRTLSSYRDAVVESPKDS